MTEFWDVIGQQDPLISLGRVLSTSWDEDDLTWGWDEEDRVLDCELWLVSRNQLSVLTNGNGWACFGRGCRSSLWEWKLIITKRTVLPPQLSLKIMKVASVTMLIKIKKELLPNRLVPRVTSSDPEGATIFIQLGTCPDNLVTADDCTSLWWRRRWWRKKIWGNPTIWAQDDDYLAGKMIDLVCVLPLRELAVE